MLHLVFIGSDKQYFVLKILKSSRKYGFGRPLLLQKDSESLLHHPTTNRGKNTTFGLFPDGTRPNQLRGQLDSVGIDSELLD